MCVATPATRPVRLYGLSPALLVILALHCSQRFGGWSSHSQAIEQELQVQMAAACVAALSLCVEEGFVRGKFNAKAVNGEGG